jgi:hypothetical protein
MITPHDNFAEYFTLAQAEAFTVRESQILDLRYGFANGEPHIIWPREMTRGSHAFEVASKLSRQREVSPDSEGKSGTFFSQKMNREVQYESLLEMHLLLKLEQIITRKTGVFHNYLKLVQQY